MTPATFLSLTRSAAPAPKGSRPAGDGRVTIVDSPDGTARLVSKTIDGRWVAEHLCLVEDVDDKLIRALELRAKKYERATLAIVK